jgi:hypothetical protein
MLQTIQDMAAAEQVPQAVLVVNHKAVMAAVDCHSLSAVYQLILAVGAEVTFNMETSQAAEVA